MAQSKAFREEIQLLRDVNVKQQVADQDINKDKNKMMKKSSSRMWWLLKEPFVKFNVFSQKR